MRSLLSAVLVGTMLTATLPNIAMADEPKMSLKQRKAIRPIQKAFPDFAKEISAKVGSEITFDVQWSFLAKRGDESLYVDGFQKVVKDTLTAAVDEAIANPATKKAFADKVKTIVITNTKDASAPIHYKYEGNTLTLDHTLGANWDNVERRKKAIIKLLKLDDVKNTAAATGSADAKVAELKQLAGGKIEVEIQWDGIVSDKKLLEEGMEKVFFAPLRSMLEQMNSDDMYKEAMQEGLKKIVITKGTRSFRDSTFKDGVLTVMGVADSNWHQGDERKKKFVSLLENGL